MKTELSQGLYKFYLKMKRNKRQHVKEFLFLKAASNKIHRKIYEIIGRLLQWVLVHDNNELAALISYIVHACHLHVYGKQQVADTSL